jgi:hypothetical protein
MKCNSRETISSTYGKYYTAARASNTTSATERNPVENNGKHGVDEVGGRVLVIALAGTEDRADFEFGPVTAGSRARPCG